MPPDRIARARELLKTALAAVDAELTTPRHALCPKQLGRCRETLHRHLTAVEAGAVPPRGDRDEGLCQLVVDSWPFDLPISGAVLAAERAYLNS